jgi:hypothetical protein
MLLNTLAPLGISYPSYSSALVVACGTPSGTTGRHLVNAINAVNLETAQARQGDAPSHLFNKRDQVR